MQGIIALIVYALLMVGATKAFTKREDGGESFHVGHRNMGMVVSAMSIAATWIWAARQWTGSIENGWKEVYEIEPDIVKEAAKKIPSAKEFLKGLE